LTAGFEILGPGMVRNFNNSSGFWNQHLGDIVFDIVLSEKRFKIPIQIKTFFIESFGHDLLQELLSFEIQKNSIFWFE
jgi:hypothetical protein